MPAGSPLLQLLLQMKASSASCKLIIFLPATLQSDSIKDFNDVQMGLETYFTAFFFEGLLSASTAEDGKALAGTALGTISSKGFHST